MVCRTNSVRVLECIANSRGPCVGKKLCSDDDRLCQVFAEWKIAVLPVHGDNEDSKSPVFERIFDYCTEIEAYESCLTDEELKDGQGSLHVTIC